MNGDAQYCRTGERSKLRALVGIEDLSCSGQKPPGYARVTGFSIADRIGVYVKSLGQFRQGVFPFDSL